MRGLCFQVLGSLGVLGGLRGLCFQDTQKNVGTSWPKLTNVSIFCGVIPKNRRHQHTEQKKGKIHDLVTGQLILCDVNIIIRPPS